MEKLAKEIEKFLKDTLELYKELTTVLKMESGYIVERDVSSLWAASARKKELAVIIQKQKNSLLVLLDKKGVHHDMSPSDFNLSGMIRVLPFNSQIKTALEKIRILLEVQKNELKQQASSNRRTIQEYLGVIDGVMSTITGATRNTSYGPKGVSGVSPSFYGTRQGRGASTSLLSAQV